MSDRTAELEAQIEAQRDQLADTVDQLTHKLDVKTQAKERAARVADRATTEDGLPRPELVAALTGVVLLLGVLVWWRRR
jgi:Protein of unknown function (DUF3618)